MTALSVYNHERLKRIFLEERETTMETETRSAQVLVNRALADANWIARIKADPAKELPQLADEVIQDLPRPLDTDPWIYRVVVGALGLAVLSAVIGAIVLAALKINPIPELLTAIGSAAVGALAGLLAPSPGKR